MWKTDSFLIYRGKEGWWGGRSGRGALPGLRPLLVLLVFLDVSLCAFIRFAVSGLHCGVWGPFSVFQ